MKNKLMRIGVILTLGIASCITAAVIAVSPKEIVLTAENSVNLFGEVNGGSMLNITSAISKSDPNKEFYLYLDSPGGSVFAGRFLVDYLSHTKRDIRCIGETSISMAFIILQACPIRYVTTGSVLMSHQISTQTGGSLKELEAAVTLMRKLEQLYDTLVSKRLGLTLDEYKKKIDPEFWMVGSGEAIANKAADEEVVVRCSIELEKDGKCPLLTPIEGR